MSYHENEHQMLDDDGNNDHYWHQMLHDDGNGDHYARFVQAGSEDTDTIGPALCAPNHKLQDTASHMQVFDTNTIGPMSLTEPKEVLIEEGGSWQTSATGVPFSDSQYQLEDVVNELDGSKGNDEFDLSMLADLVRFNAMDQDPDSSKLDADTDFLAAGSVGSSKRDLGDLLNHSDQIKVNEWKSPSSINDPVVDPVETPLAPDTTFGQESMHINQESDNNGRRKRRCILEEDNVQFNVKHQYGPTEMAQLLTLEAKILHYLAGHCLHDRLCSIVSKEAEANDESQKIRVEHIKMPLREADLGQDPTFAALRHKLLGQLDLWEMDYAPQNGTMAWHGREGGSTKCLIRSKTMCGVQAMTTCLAQILTTTVGRGSLVSGSLKGAVGGYCHHQTQMKSQRIIHPPWRIMLDGKVIATSVDDNSSIVWAHLPTSRARPVEMWPHVCQLDSEPGGLVHAWEIALSEQPESQLGLDTAIEAHNQVLRLSRLEAAESSLRRFPMVFKGDRKSLKPAGTLKIQVEYLPENGQSLPVRRLTKQTEQRSTPVVPIERCSITLYEVDLSNLKEGYTKQELFNTMESQHRLFEHGYRGRKPPRPEPPAWRNRGTESTLTDLRDGTLRAISIAISQLEQVRKGDGRSRISLDRIKVLVGGYHHLSFDKLPTLTHTPFEILVDGEVVCTSVDSSGTCVMGVLSRYNRRRDRKKKVSESSALG